MMPKYPTRQRWVGMRHFPIGRELTGAINIHDAQIHPTATKKNGWIETATNPWYYAVMVPVRFAGIQEASLGKNGLMASVRLHVRKGTAGVAMMRKDEQVIEQVPIAADSDPVTIRFHVVYPELLHQIVIRNWDRPDRTRFELLGVSIYEAIRELPASALSMAAWTDLDRPYARYLEFSITDYCNLNCPFCSQSTQLTSRSKAHITLEQLRRFSKLIYPGEFDVLKISGGEPTLHPEFGAVCDELRGLFPIPRMELASNGARLHLFADNLAMFTEIDLTHYPGRNDDEIKRITSLGLTNITLYNKCEYKELDNVYMEQNLNRVKIFENCRFAWVKKVIDERIYACPCIYGQLPIKNISVESVSVPFDENWRTAMNALEMEPICRRCFNAIEAPRLI